MHPLSDGVGSLSWNKPLEKEMVTNSSILAWEITWAEETEKVGLKLNIQKTKIMASHPITSWQTDGKQ